MSRSEIMSGKELRLLSLEELVVMARSYAKEIEIGYYPIQDAVMQSCCLAIELAARHKGDDGWKQRKKIAEEILNSLEQAHAKSQVNDNISVLHLGIQIGSLFFSSGYRSYLREYSLRQSIKGKRGAVSRWNEREGHQDIQRIYNLLAKQIDLMPSELWTQFFGHLDQNGFSPEEIIHGSSEKIEDQSYVLHGFTSLYEIKYPAFKKQIQRLRLKV